MTLSALIQLLGLLVALFILAYPIGLFIASLVRGDASVLGLAKPVEQTIYRISGIDPDHEMSWREYALNLLIFSIFGIYYKRLFTNNIRAIS